MSAPGNVAAPSTPPYLRSGDEVVAALETNIDNGLAAADAAARQAQYGPNALRSEAPPSMWRIAAGLLRDPMNLMLIAVTVISLVIGQIPTAIMVALLVLLNLVLGTRQELSARASVDALSKMQIPRSRVVRDGAVAMIPATELVPGDIVQVEAGDIAPADGRIVRCATLETQEAALTGESAPVSKGAAALGGPNVELGDRDNMLFQNTSVTRGTATIVVTATGMDTEMGRIASMLSEVKRTRSPLQRELDSLTKVLATIAWTAVAIIVIVALLRGVPFSQVMLLGTAVAISAIPTGMPAFVSALLSYGAKQLAAAKAVVKNLTDVETLGATSAINTDKTGTLTLNQMMVSQMYAANTWFTVDGQGYEKSGAIRAVAGTPTPDFTRLALGLCLDSDATVDDDGAVVGDPTEAALVVLAAKMGVDANETRRAYPRMAEVPFDSDYKFMATFHEMELDGTKHVIELVKGAPDVVLRRCSFAGGPLAADRIPIEQVRKDIEAANERLAAEGLRVLAFAARALDDQDPKSIAADPMSFTQELGFYGIVGIIDPLRKEAKSAVTTALSAGIDVRMITGDHAVTAEAIGKDLGLGPGAISGAELAALSDAELAARLPQLHVFGRVTPQDKLRLARLMQEQGMIVAMTGDAVNDAAALKQADIGVAMGSGSEVTKQAGRMILTDDNFGTLVHAIELGRTVYDKIVAYVRFQMTQLLALVMLFLAATIFNMNDGVALTPVMVLFVAFFVVLFGVIVIAVDPPDPDLMRRAPRDPKVPISNRPAVVRWVIYGGTRFFAAFIPLAWGPDELHVDTPSASMTMAFVVMCLSATFSALVMRRDPSSGLLPPLLKAAAILCAPVALTVLATELEGLQKGLVTQPLTGPQWLACIGLALVTPVVVEADKALRRRRRHPVAPTFAVADAVAAHHATAQPAAAAQPVAAAQHA